MPMPASSQELTRTFGPTRVVLDLRLGETEDSTSSFGFVTDVEVDASGRIFVLDYREQRIKVFDARGHFVRSFGRRGGGPAEFENAHRLVLMRDSLWVIQTQNRVSGFSLGSRPTARSVRLSTSQRASEWIEGIARRGFLVGTASSAGLGLGPRSVYLQIAEERGVRRDTIGVLEVPERTFSYTAVVPGSKHVARTRGVQPFMQGPLWALARSGTTLFTVTAGEGHLRILERSVAGDTLWTRQLKYAPVPVTPKDVQRYLDSISSPQPVRGVGRIVPDRRAIEAVLVRPREWPPVTGLIVGLDSTIWLRVGGPNEGMESWWVFTRTGPVELLRLPPGFRLLRASRSHVWGIRTDGDEVPLVERYRLTRS
jgi:hypothetical protein